MAYLHLSGKVPNASDELNTKARGLLIIFAQSFKILLQISSNPVELLHLIDPITLITSACVTDITFMSIDLFQYVHCGQHHVHNNILRHNIGYVTITNTVMWDLRTRPHRVTSDFRRSQFVWPLQGMPSCGRNRIVLC